MVFLISVVTLFQNCSERLVIESRGNSSTLSNGTHLNDSLSSSIKVISPASSGPYFSKQPSIDLSGTASDNNGILTLMCSVNTGSQCTVSGAATWSISGIILVRGSNVVSITAKDSSLNSNTVTFEIIYQPPEVSKDNFIYEHGRYSGTYESDWKTLPSGKIMGKKDFGNTTFREVYGEEVQKKFYQQKEVILKDLAYKVRWKSPIADKFKTTLIHIQEADKVIIDNVSIMSMDSDFRTYHTLFIQDCGQIIIKSSFFAGASNGYHIRIEGSENVTVDGLEIAGIDYFGKGLKRAGGGIWINNGDQDAPPASPNPRPPQWTVIQNCYMHDYSDSDIFRNHDGINLHSPGNGAVFNCYFENWGKDGVVADAAIDYSHRRRAYMNQSFRFERNVFDHCALTKNVGGYKTDLEKEKIGNVMWVNNIFHNTPIADYHSEFSAYFVNNTFYFKGAIDTKLLKLWSYGVSEKFLQIKNNLIVTQQVLNPVFYQNQRAAALGAYKFLVSDYNAFLIAKPTRWLGGAGDQMILWEDWQTTTRENNSLFIMNLICLKDPGHGDYSLKDDCTIKKKATIEFQVAKNAVLNISRDFSGSSRSPESATAGAFQ